MKLPISSKQSNTGAFELFDADGNKIGTIRTGQIADSGAINKANAEAIVAAVNRTTPPEQTLGEMEAADPMVFSNEALAQIERADRDE